MDNKNEKQAVVKYSKEQILSSKKYQGNRDVLSVLLEDHVRYSRKQISDILNDFNKKEVK